MNTNKGLKNEPCGTPYLPLLGLHFKQCCTFILCRLRSKFPHEDLATNPGYVLSPVITQRDAGGDNGGSVKVSIEISDSQLPDFHL